MHHDAHRLVTRNEWWLQWADAHGVRNRDACKSLDGVARDYYETCDAYRELLTSELRGEGFSASHKAAANTATHGRCSEAAIERRGGDFDLYVDPVQVRDQHGQIVLPQQSPEAVGEWAAVAPVPFATPEEHRRHDSPTTDGGFRP